MRIHVAPARGSRERIHVRPRIAVERTPLTYLEEQGWVRDGSSYRGQFRTRNGAWWGEAKLENGAVHFFIYAPPAEVFDGPHRSCFHHIGSNWWFVHFNKKASNASDGVMAVEELLENPTASAD